MTALLLILGLILFVALVVVHEFGHFIAARRNKVVVEEFGIGFPPRAKVLTEKKGTIFSLNWLPLGGFVRLRGEHDADTEKGSFGAATTWTKAKIMLAGVVFNLIAAYLLLTVLAVIGIPKVINDQFTIARNTKVVRQEILAGYVEPGSPAEKAGILRNDQLIAITSSCKSNLDPTECVGQKTERISSASGLSKLTETHAGEEILLTIKRQNQEKTLTATLRTRAEVEPSKNTDEPKGFLGVSPSEFTIQRSTWSAPIVAAGLIKQFTVLTLQGVGSAVAGLISGDGAKASEQVSGPVGIFVLLKDGSILGIEFILMIIAIISLTLAIMNSLPIPALDGGRLYVMLLFRAIRKPLNKQTEELIHGAGFALLMILFVLITVVDFKRFF